MFEKEACAILESSLLLDEDLEIILYHREKFKKTPQHSSVICPWKCLACTSTFLGSLLWFKSGNYKFFLTFFTPTIIVGSSAFLKHIRNKIFEKNLTSVIYYMKKIHKLNKKILNYLELRDSASSSKEYSIEFLHKKIKNLQEVFLQESETTIKTLKENVIKICHLVPCLNGEYNHIMDIRCVLIVHSNVENCIRETRYVSDSFTLLTSNFLCCLCLSLSTELNERGATKTFGNIRSIVSLTKGVLKHCYQNITNQYYETVCLHEVPKYVQHIKKKGMKLTSMLEHLLATYLANISLVLEKAQFVALEAERSQSEEDVKKVKALLEDLKNHTYQSYESLDIITKLYDTMLISSSKLTNSDGVHNPENKVRENNKILVATINPDDQEEEREDEEYELFIGTNNPIEKDMEAVNNEEVSSEYLHLMIRELKQSLQRHQRFIDARKKRGIVDENDQNSKEQNIQQKSEEINSVFSELNSLSQANAFADIIRAASKQRMQNEVIFGDSSADDTTDDES